MCTHTHNINKNLICMFMQSQHLLFKPADHNQLQPIQLPSTCNTWYQEKVCSDAQCSDSDKHMQDHCLCVRLCELTCGLFSGWLIVMFDWLPAGFITLHQRQKRTSWPLTHRSLSLFLSLSLSFCLSHCLHLSLTEPSSEPIVGWLWFCLPGQAVGKHFDWRDRTKLTLPRLKQLSCAWQSHRSTWMH